MKKIILLLIFLLSSNICFAQDNLSFIYINGSNNNNEKMKNWFLKGVNKLHPVLKSQIEKNKETQKHLLNNGELLIDSKPDIFFWGDKSKEDFAYMNSRVQMMKGVSPLIAYLVRGIIADCLHDAIWVQKDHNMYPILMDLDKKVKEAAMKKKKVVLLGYSAGTFITYQYLFTKLPYIDMQRFFEKNPTDAETMKFIQQNPRKKTCFFAFVEADIADITELGNIVNNKNPEELRQGYKNLDKFTDEYCVPEDVLYGVINFASPLPLFYSDIYDKKFPINAYNDFLYKYLIEHDFFFLTVNFVEDPLGFPTASNLTNKEIKEILGIEYENQKGFIYDYPKTWSYRTFMLAHTSYWSARKRFASGVVKGFIEGYNYQYDPEFQTKMLKKRKLR